MDVVSDPQLEARRLVLAEELARHGTWECLTGKNRTPGSVRLVAQGYLALAQRVEGAETALDALLDHAERIQEHVPKSEHWYAVRDCARQALRQEDE